MILLDAQKIAHNLPFGEVKIFDEIDSTNEYLLRNFNNLPSGSLCLTETQTAGRGRRGRQWYSPFGQNLYFSMLWRYQQTEMSNISALSLIVALVIAETFEKLEVQDIQIKWPNDIYYQGKKMGGILIESKIDHEDIYLVIGIGLNLAMETINPTIVNQPWSDLSAYHFDRNRLANQLAYTLQQTLHACPHQHLDAYLSRWQKFDCFYQQPVKLITSSEEIHGIAQGINSQGELLLQQGDQIIPFAIGELSLRAN